MVPVQDAEVGVCPHGWRITEWGGERCYKVRATTIETSILDTALLIYRTRVSLALSVHMECSSGSSTSPDMVSKENEEERKEGMKKVGIKKTPTL